MREPPSRDPTSTPPVVQLAAVGKHYEEGGRRRIVLDGADLEIATGEFVVLLGKSGSGKSTLLHLVSGIDLPDAGSVLVRGVALERLSEEERTLFRRRHVGLVFQFFNLIPTLTVEENVRLPLELAGRTGPTAVAAAKALLAEVGLAARGASFPESLSGGEQQRVAVARALVHDPDLVLADEPTGNLDHDTSLEVLDLLDRLTRRAGKTLLMATHSREVIGIADRVLAVEDGRLVELQTTRPAGTAGAAPP